MNPSLIVEFFVPGVPRGAGSKKPVTNKYTGKTYVIDASANAKEWKQCVTFAARAARHGCAVVDETLALEVQFFMPRPKGHYRSNGQLKATAPEYHTSAPDATKLTRGTEDALTGVVWRDDRLVAVQLVSKPYSNDGRTGALIRVWRLAAGSREGTDAMADRDVPGLIEAVGQGRLW